jgi:hypothetical protein
MLRIGASLGQIKILSAVLILYMFATITDIEIEA